MPYGAKDVHEELKKALKNYIVSQYFGKSPLLLKAVPDKLDIEGEIFKEPYIESSPKYETVSHGIQKSEFLESWMIDYFDLLIKAKLGVFETPFKHQVKALERAVAGKDVFVATGTGSGKTECFMWPIMAKLAQEAKNNPKSWACQGIRTIILYPMNALVSDQLSRLRRIMGDSEGKFSDIFRTCCGKNIRRPQFGMYTGRTPYAGDKPVSEDDKKMVRMYQTILDSSSEESFFERLKKEGKLPAKKDLQEFLDKLSKGIHKADTEDAELVTRFEMHKDCPDILITNYSMLEYMLLRPIEQCFWEKTRKWLQEDTNNKLLFVIDEAHMYRGSSGGEVSYLLRRVFHKLGITRDRVQFILTTASMPSSTDSDLAAIRKFANSLTAQDNDNNEFYLLFGDREKIEADNIVSLDCSLMRSVDIDKLNGNETEKLEELNAFCRNVLKADNIGSSLHEVCDWLYYNLASYDIFYTLLQRCRGEAVSFQKLKEEIFFNNQGVQADYALNVVLSVASLAKNKQGSVLFPARMHMLFRGIKGVFACTNPNCPKGHSVKNLSVGEIYFDSQAKCIHCNSAVYELYNDRRCGSLFFKGYVVSEHLTNEKKTFLWNYPNSVSNENVKEIHLFIPENDFSVKNSLGKDKIKLCYLDIKSGFIDFTDDSLAGKEGIRKLYYSNNTVKSKPNMVTFASCPHCLSTLSKTQLTSFNTIGNQAFSALMQAQFITQPPVSDKMGNKEKYPNEGRKILLFSDSRQRAAKLARDMSDIADFAAARQLAVLAIDLMNKSGEYSLDDFYAFFALQVYKHKIKLFHGDAQQEIWELGKKYFDKYVKHNFITVRNKVADASANFHEYLIKFYCGSYNTFWDFGISWLEPTKEAMNEILEEFDEMQLSLTEKDVLELTTAWIFDCCHKYTALGPEISTENVRYNVRPSYLEFGLEKNWRLSKQIIEIMMWNNEKGEMEKIKEVFEDIFLQKGTSNNADRKFIQLNKVTPRFDKKHIWHVCRQCSEFTPYPLKGKCPNCGSEKLEKVSEADEAALAFWKKSIFEALDGQKLYTIDTEEHTAQLSYKDQRDNLWAKTEEYELRFQDFLREDEAPVDILSSTTTMEVGIDIGSLVAVGLRNFPPMRENYQQRAGRAGRRGASLSTIVTWCENSSHDILYYNDPEPMFKGDPRSPWIDVSSSKIIARHLTLVIVQSFLETKNLSVDSISTEKFFKDEFEPFLTFFNDYSVSGGVLLKNRSISVENFKQEIQEQFEKLSKKYKELPELYIDDYLYNNKPKMLLDTLYEEGIIPTYSFPKDVVSMYIMKNNKLEYRIERGLNIAINEYAPGRAIVVDKETYPVGALYYPVRCDKGVKKSVTERFLSDRNYCKSVKYCKNCGWFDLESKDNKHRCPLCEEPLTDDVISMVRPWGFAPKNGKSVSAVQVEEEYSTSLQPVYPSLPPNDDFMVIEGCQNIRVANRSNQRIVMLNQGPERKGFYVCSDCGVMIPGNHDPKEMKEYSSPYLIYKRCNHSNKKHVSLGYDFITDMLVLEIALGDMINSDIQSGSWLNRAGLSLAEAFRLVLCKELDIEFSELITGYRIRKKNGKSFIDIYIHDSLSSGAGYASVITSSLYSVLNLVKEYLNKCDCADACHRCLKHYGNQYVQGNLNRKYAVQLLEWGINSAIVPDFSIEKQINYLSSFDSVIHSLGGKIEVRENRLFYIKNGVEKTIEVYPAMLKQKQSVMLSFSEYQTTYAKLDVYSELSN